MDINVVIIILLLIYVVYLKITNKKLIDVEIQGTTIIFKSRRNFVFFKKMYYESIDINKVNKIEKQFERTEFTSIVFRQNVTEINGVDITTIDSETLNLPETQETIESESILYQVSACNYIGSVPELFDKLSTTLDLSNIEIIDRIM